MPASIGPNPFISKVSVIQCCTLTLSLVPIKVKFIIIIIFTDTPRVFYRLARVNIHTAPKQEICKEHIIISLLLFKYPLILLFLLVFLRSWKKPSAIPNSGTEIAWERVRPFSLYNSCLWECGTVNCDIFPSLVDFEKAFEKVKHQKCIEIYKKVSGLDVVDSPLFNTAQRPEP